MARIRTIKPELWTDPEFVECSPNARLLFVAALNFASDYGVLPDQPKRLKMQCFPADGFDIEPLIDELVDAGFWERRTAPDGANVLVIRTFSRHQKVDKPTLGRWGDPSKWPSKIEEPSPSTPGDVDERSDTEGKGRDLLSAGGADRRSNPLYDALVEACGLNYDEMTRQARRACGVAAAELANVGATPTDIKARAHVYRQKFRNASLTPSALARQWATCTTPKQRTTVNAGTGDVMLPGADY